MTRIQHVCCGQWFDTQEEETEHRHRNLCPSIEAAKERYRREGPITVEIGGQLITARTPAWDEN